MTYVQSIFDWLQQGVRLDQFSSPGMALLAAFGLGFVFGALPIGASELLALAAGAVQPRSLIIPLLILLTLGHVLGKLLWYWLGTFGSRVTHPKAVAWIAKAHEFNELHPALGVGVLLSSAFASIPPFHVMAVAAGIVRLPLVEFLGTAVVGRLLRFGLVALVPGVVKWLM